jgi:hypothetical protein
MIKLLKMQKVWKRTGLSQDIPSEERQKFGVQERHSLNRCYRGFRKGQILNENYGFGLGEESF